MTLDSFSTLLIDAQQCEKSMFARPTLAPIIIFAHLKQHQSRSTTPMYLRAIVSSPLSLC